jgi:hypothetical protein
VSTSGANDLPVVLISLMRGVVDREISPALWQALVATQARVRDHITVIGLELVLDDAEGIAYLRQRPQIVGEPELPRLITRRQLSFSISLALALLRKKLAEFDATSGETRLIITGDEILDMMRLFLPDTTNQAKLKGRVDTDINRIVDLGFLRPLKGRESTYEVRRILRSFVDAQWLGHLNERLAAYATHAGTSEDEETQSFHDRAGA